MQEEFHKSCRLGDLLSIESLLKSSPEIIHDLDPSLGWSAVYRSVVCGHFDAVSLLLRYSADPNFPNTSGETPLHQAVESDQFSIAELLLQHKADPNIAREDGDTPLHLAVSRSLSKMVSLLLSFGAEPELQNFMNKMTPLDYAADKPGITAIIQEARLLDLKLNTPEPQASPSPDEVKSVIEPEREDSSKNTLYQWLARINLLEIFEILTSQGYDDLHFLLEQMRSEPLTLELLEEIGVRKIGQRMTLLAFLEEEIHRYLRKSVPIRSDCCAQKQEVAVPSLKEWLYKINLQGTFGMFVEAGFCDVEQMVFLMNTNYQITDEVLKKVGVEKIGHRQRILIKLKEEAKGMMKNYSFLISESEAKNSACGFCVSW